MKKHFLISFLLILCCSAGQISAQRLMETLNRGLVAVQTSENSAFVSWRIFGYDPANVAFNLYADGKKINAKPLTLSNFTANNSTAETYTVKTVVGGKETGEEQTVEVLKNQYIEIPLNTPAPMMMPDSSLCFYTPNDCSAGDVDGDGELELIVKFDPSNAKDNSHSGYTGNVYLDV
ncbi:MAG: hypothetical protein LBN23_00340 [Paludibacter sp.]|jgi:rhamnogalacturonan endolyase|nr:hypothetical protein [Paludibacter sp.]